MKRGEMVELIQNEFNLVEGMAEEILALIESKGMLPPFYLQDVKDSSSFSTIATIGSYEWEPESEEK